VVAFSSLRNAADVGRLRHGGECQQQNGGQQFP
jgi:hypothetical protein